MGRKEKTFLNHISAMTSCLRLLELLLGDLLIFAFSLVDLSVHLGLEVRQDRVVVLKRKPTE